VKYCRSCFHLSAGRPTFCPSCGGSYDVKRCPRGHANPRSSQVCGECGSRELSTPQPRRTITNFVGLVLSRVFLGAALLAATFVYAVVFAVALIRDPTQLLGRMVFGLGFALAWLLYVSIA
jgi:RNA polymerase subunit RPABC4/transcription elongation factor Spt4